MDKNFINSSIKKIDEFIHNIDPLGLGGAKGEYSQVTYRLFRIAEEKKGN